LYCNAEDKAALGRVQAQRNIRPRLIKDGGRFSLTEKISIAWQRWPNGGGWEINDKGELFVAKKGRTSLPKRRYCDYVIECDFKGDVQETAEEQQRVFCPHA